jgi:hypothetical protein
MLFFGPFKSIVLKIIAKTKMKVSHCLIKQHVIKLYQGVEVKLFIFLSPKLRRKVVGFMPQTV